MNRIKYCKECKKESLMVDYFEKPNPHTFHIWQGECECGYRYMFVVSNFRHPEREFNMYKVEETTKGILETIVDKDGCRKEI